MADKRDYDEAVEGFAQGDVRPASVQLRLVHLSGDPQPLQCCPNRRFAALAPATVPRFRVSVVRADGSSSERIAIGGHSAGHAAAAIEDAGIGGLVRVIRETEAA